jgi:hypothetical protein
VVEYTIQTPSFFPIDFDVRTSDPSTTTVGVDGKIFCHIGKGFFCFGLKLLCNPFLNAPLHT